MDAAVLKSALSELVKGWIGVRDGWPYCTIIAGMGNGLGHRMRICRDFSEV